MKDEEIIRLLEKRDEQAITELSSTYGAYCRKIALRLLPLPEDAEEIVNDVLLRAWDTIPPLKPQDLRHYLAKLTRNLACDLVRRQQAEKRGGGELPLVLEELENCIPSGETPEASLTAKELGAAISRFLDTQPKRTMDIFLRRYYFAESSEEIAAACRMRTDNVRLTLSRTRAKLKAYLEKGGYL